MQWRAPKDNFDWSSIELATYVFAVLRVPDTLLVGFGGSLELFGSNSVTFCHVAASPGLVASAFHL